VEGLPGTYIASLIAFGLGGLALVGSVSGLAAGRRTPAVPVVSQVGEQTQTKAA
jgi:hypothetical protein